jgi:hypothetical protein
VYIELENKHKELGGFWGCNTVVTHFLELIGAAAIGGLVAEALPLVIASRTIGPVALKTVFGVIIDAGFSAAADWICKHVFKSATIEQKQQRGLQASRKTSLGRA